MPPKNLKNSWDFVLGAVKQNPLVLQYVENEEFVLAAVTQNPLALQYVPEIFKNVQSFVLGAVTQNPSVLQHVSEDMISVLVGKMNYKAYDGRFKLRDAILLFLQNEDIDSALKEDLAEKCKKEMKPQFFSIHRRRQQILTAADAVLSNAEKAEGKRKEQENNPIEDGDKCVNRNSK